MKTLKTQTMHVGNTAIDYSIVVSGESFGLEVSTKGDFEEYILVEDVTREFEEAEKLLKMFAENTVFPDNVLEIFDDLLGS